MKILVGYDGSDVAKEALALAQNHAKIYNASVDVVTSMTKGDEDNLEDIENSKGGLEYAKTLFDKENIPCETHLLIRGLSPGEDIVRFAGTNNIDEIIVGVKKISKVGKFLLGSTAQYVILKAHCPVVTVK